MAWSKRQRYAREIRNRLREELPAQQSAQLMHFKEKATGWMLAAGGAGLIAVAETWNLREAYSWPQAAFWLLVAFMIIASVFFTVERARIRQEFLGLERRLRRGRSGRGD